MRDSSDQSKVARPKLKLILVAGQHSVHLLLVDLYRLLYPVCCLDHLHYSLRFV